MLASLGADAFEVRTPEELEGLDGLVIPGGESTTISMGMERDGLDRAIRVRHRGGMPIFGSCAGMIVCDRDHLGLADYLCRRNAFGRQLQSFEEDLRIAGLGDEPLRAVFIRAPWVEEHGPDVEVLAEVRGHPVAVRDGNVLAVAFHAELTDDSRLHAAFMAMCTAARSGQRASLGFRDERSPRNGARPDPRPPLHQGGRGRRLHDRGRVRRRAAAAGGLRGGPPGGRQSDRSHGDGGAVDVLLRARLRRAAAMDLAGCGVGDRERGRPHRGDGEPEHTRALPGAARAPGGAPGGDPEADEAGDGAERRGQLPLGAHPVPDPRVRIRGRDVPAPPSRTSTTAPAWRPTTIPVGAWARTSEETKRLADWIQGRSEVHVTGEGTDLRLGIEGRDLHRRRRRAQHARRRVLHRPGRGLGRGRDHLPPARQLRRPRGVRRALPLRGRQGRRRDAPRRARSS